MIKNVSTSEEYSPPCRMPNGLQWYKDHLYVMDQQTDQKSHLKPETENRLSSLSRYILDV